MMLYYPTNGANYPTNGAILPYKWCYITLQMVLYYLTVLAYVYQSMYGMSISLLTCVIERRGVWGRDGGGEKEDTPMCLCGPWYACYIFMK